MSIKVSVRSALTIVLTPAAFLSIRKTTGLFKVTGDADHWFTSGHLCPKMAHYEKTVHSPERLTQPLIRCGSKGLALFARHLEEAIETIVAVGRKSLIPMGQKPFCLILMPAPWASSSAMQDTLFSIPWEPPDWSEPSVHLPRNMGGKQ